MKAEFRRFSLFAIGITIALAAGSQTSPAQDPGDETIRTPPLPSADQRHPGDLFMLDREETHRLDALASTPCVGGFAGIYPCDKVDLLAFMPLADIGGGQGNDIWGWTDPLDGKEYAIMGRTSGTAFVDIGDPENPVYLGNLPPQTSNSTWRDIKVRGNHAFIVSEASNHGMQVFDLTELRSVAAPPATFAATAHYGGFGSAHNIVVNEDSAYAYAVGASSCSGGLHMIDIAVPTSPVFAGCVSGDGYTHDAQCVNYTGPDPDHAGKEICFNSNEDTVTIFDVTDKANPVQLSRTGYAGLGYTHQGWLTPDHATFLLGDELDEDFFGHNTRTRIFDVSDLDAPVIIGIHDATTRAIDHNLYTVGNHAFQASYRAGVRVLDSSDAANGNLSETGFFDVYPSNDNARFNGAWSVYPYFESGVIVVSGIEQGLFILDPGAAVGGELSIALDSTTPSVPQGGSFPFSFDILNETGSDQTFAFALALLAPGSPQPNIFVGPIPLNLPDGGNVMAGLNLPISATAPLGGYTLVGVLVDTGGGGLIGLDTIGFQVEAGP